MAVEYVVLKFYVWEAYLQKTDNVLYHIFKC